MSDTALCIYCEKIKTTNRDADGKPQCASCSNDQYFKDLRNGNRVELKINMRKVKQSTLTMIKALIQKDIEEYENKNS
jgi:hypothetical protein